MRQSNQHSQNETESDAAPSDSGADVISATDAIANAAGHSTTRRQWLERAGHIGAGFAVAQAAHLAAHVTAATAAPLPSRSSPPPPGQRVADARPSNLRSFDVRQFGARGDSVADDTKAAQSALDAAVRVGGGRVHFPAGRYRITRSLTLSSSERMDITGDGATSVLLHEADEPLLLWKEGAACRECSVRHLCFTSTGRDKSRGTAVIACLGGAERAFFSHLLFNTAGARMGSGIVVQGVMDTTTLEHCVMWGPISGTGVRVAAGSEVRIFGGRIIGSHGIYESAPNRESIGVHLAGGNGGVHIVTTDIIALGTALQIGEAGNPSNREVFITHATFDSCRHGVRQSDAAYTSIAGCWAASSDEDQILVEPSARGAILSICGGTIFNGGAYNRPGAHHGLVARAGSFMLSGVSVRHNKGIGLLVGADVQDYAVTGCRIADNGTGAVLEGRNFTFTGNVLSRNKTQLVATPRPDRLLTGNLIARDDA